MPLQITFFPTVMVIHNSDFKIIIASYVQLKFKMIFYQIWEERVIYASFVVTF